MMKTLMLLLPFLLLASQAFAGNQLEKLESAIDQREFDYDESVGGKWKEQESSVPPVSQDALMQMQIDHGPQGIVFYLDSNSIMVNEKDRITRYWLVARNGNETVSMNFEALRCSSREYKQLGYARPDRPEDIRRIDGAKWRKIRTPEMKDHHAEIADTYLCAGTTPKPREGVIASLKGNYDSFNPYAEFTDH